MTNDERWYSAYKSLKTYISDHGHLPSKRPDQDGKWMLNWAKFQRKKIKEGSLAEEKVRLFLELMAERSTEHTGGRKKNPSLPIISQGEGD